MRMLWDCSGIALVLPRDCYGAALALLQYLCGITLELPRETALGLLRDCRRIPVGWFEGYSGFVV